MESHVLGAECTKAKAGQILPSSNAPTMTSKERLVDSHLQQPQKKRRPGENMSRDTCDEKTSRCRSKMVAHHVPPGQSAGKGCGALWGEGRRVGNGPTAFSRNEKKKFQRLLENRIQNAVRPLTTGCIPTPTRAEPKQP
jgi:hypothetical protein